MSQDYYFKKRHYPQVGGQDENTGESGFGLPWAGWGWFVIAMIIIIIISLTIYFIVSSKITVWKGEVDNMMVEFNKVAEPLKRVQNAIQSGFSQGLSAASRALTSAGVDKVKSGISSGIGGIRNSRLPFPGI